MARGITIDEKTKVPLGVIAAIVVVAVGGALWGARIEWAEAALKQEQVDSKTEYKAAIGELIREVKTVGADVIRVKAILDDRERREKLDGN